MLCGIVNGNTIYFFHHVLSFCFYGMTSFYGLYPMESFLILGMGEASGPFNGLREIFKTWEYNGTIGVINDGIFCVVFVFIRTVMPEYFIAPILYGQH